MYENGISLLNGEEEVGQLLINIEKGKEEENWNYFAINDKIDLITSVRRNL